MAVATREISGGTSTSFWPDDPLLVLDGGTADEPCKDNPRESMFPTLFVRTYSIAKRQFHPKVTRLYNQ